MLLGGLVGGGLAVVGATMQALVRNSLADPYLLGVSSGASLGAVAVILLGFSGARWDYLGLPALALLFGTLYLTVQARSLLPT